MSHKLGITILGAVDGGFDWKQLVSAAAEAANRGIEYKQQQDATAASEREVAAKAAAVIDADRKYTNALAEALFTAVYANDGNPANVAKAQAAKMLADQAERVQVAAALNLPPGASTRRTTEANKAAEEAARAYLEATTVAAAAPKDAAKQQAAVKAKARADAAQVTAAKAASWQVAQAPSATLAPVPLPPLSFWTRPVLGPIPGWGVVLGGVGGALGIGWLAFWRKVR